MLHGRAMMERTEGVEESITLPEAHVKHNDC